MNKRTRNAVVIALLCIIGLSIGRRMRRNQEPTLAGLVPPETESFRDAVAGHAAGGTPASLAFSAPPAEGFRDAVADSPAFAPPAGGPSGPGDGFLTPLGSSDGNVPPPPGGGGDGDNPPSNPGQTVISQIEQTPE